MSKTIWKFPLDPDPTNALRQEIQIPYGAKFLSLQIQGGVPVVWAVVDPSNDLVPRGIMTFATGTPCARETEDYIGTLQHRPTLVYHYFDDGENFCARRNPR